MLIKGLFSNRTKKDGEKMAEKFEKRKSIFTVLVILVDIVLINVGYYLAFLIKFNFNPPRFNISPYIEIIPFIILAGLLYFDLYGLLSVFSKSLYDTIYSLFFALGFLCLTTIAITYFNQGFSFPRSVLLIAPIIQFMLLSFWRWIVWKLKKYLLDTKEVVVLGNDIHEVENIVEKIKAPASNMLLEIKYIGDVNNMERAFNLINMADEVFICSDISSEQKAKLISYCVNKGKGIYLIPKLPEIIIYRSQMLQFDDIPTFAIEKLGLSLGQRFIKRIFDIVISLTGIIILLPLMLIIGLAIKLTSKGPIIYTQERVTRDGKVFKLYKFRTMVENAEEKTGPVMAVEGDSRITPIGNIMRKWRLDEIPQLFNVLKGDMSIVGPRPERPYFVDQFKKEIPGYEYRTLVKAGITGLAQVLGKYSTLPEDKLRYDLLYIKNYSILFDLKLILQTLKVIFISENSKGFKKSVQNNLDKSPFDTVSS